jgi:ABC-type branched-subunit amino acid transport system ATPase component
MEENNVGPLLEAKDIHLSFGGLRALDGISVDVAEG